MTRPTTIELTVDRTWTKLSNLNCKCAAEDIEPDGQTSLCLSLIVALKMRDRKMQDLENARLGQLDWNTNNDFNIYPCIIDSSNQF